jgi:hypothetical protein
MVFANFKNNGIRANKTNYRTQTPSRDEVIDVLFEGIVNLERGLKRLGKLIPTPVGRIDILAMDMVGRIVIVEVGKGEEEELLFRAIDHFDWALANMRDLEEKYKIEDIDPTLAPRIVILAPSYSEKFIKRASYLNPTFIDIYEYQLQESLGIKRVYFRPLSFINRKKWVLDIRTKSVEDHIEYLQDEELRGLLKELILEIQSWRSDYLIDTSKGYVGFRDKKDQLVLGIYVLKNGFWINLNRRRWEGKFIKNKMDLEGIKTYIAKYLRKEGR